MSYVISQTERRRRQQEVLDAIIDFIDLRGFAPTDREIAELVDRKLWSTHQIVQELIVAGAITREPVITRSIQVIRNTVL